MGSPAFFLLVIFFPFLLTFTSDATRLITKIKANTIARVLGEKIQNPLESKVTENANYHKDDFDGRKRGLVRPRHLHIAFARQKQTKISEQKARENGKSTPKA